jgi:hypothetical protein
MDVKGPMLPNFAHYYRGEPVPESVYEAWATSNIQIITGNTHHGPTKLLVVDLDGEESKAKFKRICTHNDYKIKSPWICRTGSGGIHLYYLLPSDAEKCPSGMIWGLWDTFGDDGKGRWEKHQEIRVLADNALVIAPPSIHVDTGERYAFLPLCGPNEIAVPEEAPGWLLAMPRLSSPRTQAERPKAPRMEHQTYSGAFHRREEVLAAIPDKVAIAREWGLDFAASHPNESGWVSCYAVGREERNPSGSFHADGGIYQDRMDMSTCSLFDLGVLLQPGAFPRWQDCRDWCGDRFLGGRR